jgi:hypothetical protein
VPFDPADSATTLRPGERLVAGRPYVYDWEALADWLAIEAKLDAPDDLAVLTDEALTALFVHALRLAAISGHRDLDLAVGVEAERARRARPRLENAA